MPWIKKISGPHECQTPFNDGVESFEPGSLWRCDKCNKLWEFKPYWLDAHRWKEVKKD